MYISSPLVPLDTCLTAAACFSSACSFTVSQASDMGLLVGYVSKNDFNFALIEIMKRLDRDWVRCYGNKVNALYIG